MAPQKRVFQRLLVVSMQSARHNTWGDVTRLEQEGKTRFIPSHLSDAEWGQIAPLCCNFWNQDPGKASAITAFRQSSRSDPSARARRPLPRAQVQRTPR